MIIGLDVKTLNYLASLSTLVLSTVVFSLHFSKEHCKSIKLMALSLFLISIACFFRGFYGVMTSYLSTLLAGVFLISGFILLSRSFCEFLGESFRCKSPAVYFISISFFILYYLTHTNPSYRLADIFTGTSIAIVLSFASLEMLKIKSKIDSNKTIKFIAASFAVMAVSFYIRAVNLHFVDTLDESALNSLSYQLPYFCWALCKLTLVISLIWIIIDRRETTINSTVFEDTLTPFFNRKILPSIPTKLLATSRSEEQTLSVLMCDIDNFKIVNDNKGHLVGDQVLKEISELIMKNLRDSDIPVRYGGDEFLIFLPKTTLKHALLVAERIREAVHAQNYSGRFNVAKDVTVSIGVSVAVNGEALDSLISKTDKALYKAKMAGRNRIEFTKQSLAR